MENYTRFVNTSIDINEYCTPSSQYILISFVSILSFLFLIFFIVSVYLIVRFKQVKSFLSESDVKEFRKGRLKRTSKGDIIIDGNVCGENVKALRFEREYELSREEITINKEKVLGFGCYGIVYKGTVKGYPAAIKVPNGNCTKGTFKTFLAEVKVLCHLGTHPNILEFVGAHVREIRRGILHIATELCSNGCLESFLRRKSHVTTRDSNRFDQETLEERTVSVYELHKFSMEIAKGMEYISNKKIVHGDLATRNVFLDYGNVCKIGDFGLSRKLQEYQVYMKNSYDPIPWKWMAYESLTKQEFTCESDVWGYGVTVWEIFSLGSSPYAGLSWSPEFANDLKTGLRLPVPPFATAEIYENLLDCWHINPERRTSCTAMLDYFKGFCESEYIVIDIEQVNSNIPWEEIAPLDNDGDNEDGFVGTEYVTLKTKSVTFKKSKGNEITSSDYDSDND